MRERRVGIATLAIGIVAIVAAQRGAPVLTPPIYDGVAVQEPYRWLTPLQGQPGGPTSAANVVEAVNGANPLVALGTGELPPQAQVFATPGSLDLPAGTTTIKISIPPVAPSTLPTAGRIDGNVYRITLTNQAGVEITAPAAQQVTVVMRSPGDEPLLTIEQLTHGGWKPLETQAAGFAPVFTAVVTRFGDFALVARRSAGSPPATVPNGVVNPATIAGPTGPAIPVATPGGQGGISSAVFAVVIALALLGMLIASDVRRRNRRRPPTGGARRR